MERVTDTPLGQCTMNLACAFQNEGVVTVVVERVLAGQSLIDQQWFVHHHGQVTGHIQGRVLVSPDGMMHPVEDEFALSGYTPGIDQEGAFPEVDGKGVNQGVHPDVGETA